MVTQAFSCMHTLPDSGSPSDWTFLSLPHYYSNNHPILVDINTASTISGRPFTLVSSRKYGILAIHVKDEGDEHSLNAIQCHFCHQMGANMRCSKCKFAHYCGQECQRRDWDAKHYKICNQLAQCAIFKNPVHTGVTPESAIRLGAKTEVQAREFISKGKAQK